MRAGQITVSTRAFGVVDVPTPQAVAGQVRIKVAAAGVCLSDVHFLDGILSPGYLSVIM
jgi:D-arabinose 1-dehydrogenase-like Zn-dependent alcohol dehydrogenase